MVHIVMEENYKDTTWCERIVGGIEKRAKSKKIEYDFKSTNSEMCEADAIIVVGTTPAWVYESINLIKSKYQSHIILVSNRPYKLSVSNVCTDLFAAVKDVLQYLKSCGKTKTALYGVNPSSTADNIKLSAFEKKEDVYYNLGDLHECCGRFLNDIAEYDSVICTNDYAAVSLINTLKKHNADFAEKLFIVGFANTHLAKLCSPSVTSVALNYDEYGKVAIDIYRMLAKNPNLHSVNVNIKSEIVVRETTANIPNGAAMHTADTAKSTAFDFYKDSEIQELVKIEKLFENCEESDYDIITSLVCGNSYEQTADKVFMTVNGIKYRLDKLCRICGFENRKELVSILKSNNDFMNFQNKT